MEGAQVGYSIVCNYKTRQGILKGKYHCTVDLLFDWFGLVCFANKNKNCPLSYSWFQTSQTGGQWYSDTSPFSIPWTRVKGSSTPVYYVTDLITTLKGLKALAFLSDSTEKKLFWNFFGHVKWLERLFGKLLRGFFFVSMPLHSGKRQRRQ